MLLATLTIIQNSELAQTQPFQLSFLNIAYRLLSNPSYRPKPQSRPLALPHDQSFKPILSHRYILLFLTRSTLSATQVATFLHYYLFSPQSRHTLASTYRQGRAPLLGRTSCADILIFSDYSTNPLHYHVFSEREHQWPLQPKCFCFTFSVIQSYQEKLL